MNKYKLLCNFVFIIEIIVKVLFLFLSCERQILYSLKAEQKKSMPQQYRDASERNRSSSSYEDEEEEYYDDDEEYHDEEEEEEEQETTESDDDDEEQEASFSPRDLDQQEEASGKSSDLRQSQTTTTFNDIEHSLLAPLYDHDRRPLEGFTTEEVPESWSVPAKKNHDVVSKSAASPFSNSSHNSPGSRASTLPPPSPALSPSTPSKRTKINRKVITKRIVGGVPQTVSVVKNGVPKLHQHQRDFDENQQAAPKIMGLHDVPRGSTTATTTMKPSAQPSPSLSKSKNIINVPKNKNQPQKKKKKIAVVKKKNGNSSLVSEAEKKLRQKQEEECFAPLLNVKPPAGNRASFATFLPTKFALLLVLGVIGAVAYSVFTLVIGASSFEEHASLESCNQLTPTTGVRAVPYRMIVLASVSSVLFPIIINLIKYRARQNQLEREEKKQKYELEQSLLQKQNTKKRRQSARLVTRTRIVERVRLVPVYGRNEDDDEEEMEGEEEEAFEEEEEYEEEIACEEEEEEEEAENEDTADQRSLTNSSFRSEEARQQDEVETFSLTSERLPFLTSIKRQSYRELGWIFQTYATIDGRWYLLILIFALANFFFNIVQVSSVERDSTFRASNIWDRYQSMYMRWFQSGTVSVLGVFFSQFLTSFICSEIAGMPTEVHDDEFLKKKLDLLKRQQMESADQELILGARQMTSSAAGTGKKSTKNNKSASASGSSGSVSAEEFEEMKTKKKFSTSAASLLQNQDTMANNSQGLDDASREREEAIKLKDMRSLSRVIGNIPLPLATLLVSTSPENTETLTFTHVFFGGLLLYPGMITHVIPSFVVFLPMSILFSIPLLLCYLITKYELRPFAALVERENGKEALCRRHRSSVICMIIVSRIVSVFVLTAMFQTLMCYSTMFFVRGRASYGETIVNEVQYRDVDCFLWAVNHESVYQWSVVGLIFS